MSALAAWTGLRSTVAEAGALGAGFRITGADVAIDGLDGLPAELAQSLDANRGLLWHYLGGQATEAPALALAQTLGVGARVVETVPDARAAVRQLILDLRCRGGHLSFDIETTPRPGHGTPRPPVALNRDGGLSAVQPPMKDRTALDPHRARAASVQLYAGGATCFVIRGAALDLVLGSHWLRRQRLVAHNAGFDVAFVRQHDRPAPARRTMGSTDCTMQATGLVLGVGDYGGGGRSLARAAQALLGITLPKALVASDWAAARLSPGQVAYAASDAIVTWRLWPILLERMQAEGTLDAYQLQCSAIPAVAAMELRGLGIDRDEHTRQAAQWARELADARQAYVEDTGNPPPSRPAEIRAWLHDVLTPLQLSRWPRTVKTGELSTSSKALKHLVEKVPSAAPVLVMLAKQKLISAFGASLIRKISPVTGRIHCHYKHRRRQVWALQFQRS